ncbi:ATP-binding cassette subfamily C protein [Sphingomonas vulcanisoli]|uniref:ATP-binding cassette subfamily C protein n=2 Tax=Sphingomonas vulcanisoli TaxID=1658060 RepID=A0ABX0TX82_9SPHN|nr:ATP-binding cassette subfamily C protein [Sphingomonas vulcanisoli]
MMLVYDVVLPSHSISTLLGLLLMVALAYSFQAGFDLLRTRTLSHLGAAIETDFAPLIYRIISTSALRGRPQSESLQPIRDMDQVRGFLSGSGPSALMDLPWVLFFLAVLSFFHIWLGVTTLVGALLLIALAFLTDIKSRAPARLATEFAARRSSETEAIRRHAEEIKVMGLGGRAENSWLAVNRHYLATQQQLADISTGLGGIGRIARMLLQSTVLTVGAALVIDNKASGGVIFASSILSARALAPIDQSIGNWRIFISARQSWRRLDAQFAALRPSPSPTSLPPPEKTLAVEHVTLMPPGARVPTVIDASFTLNAKDAVAVIGPSAAGKSTLVRAITGVWPLASGQVRLDGGALDQWSSDALGTHIGYLPQTVELMEGTVAQNIARFEPDAPPELIVTAARTARVHDLILRLEHGYDTLVGPDGNALSAGQRQRIALARALYRDPFLIVLDEANSNLDAEGEQALIEAIFAVRRRGGIVITVAHRPSMLRAVDHVLVMGEGRVRAFGPKAEVMAKLNKQARAAQAAAPLVQT